MKKSNYYFILLLVVLTFPLAAKEQKIDAARLLQHVKILAADSLSGRRTCSRGAELARNYLRGYFYRLQLQPLFESFSQKFTVETERLTCTEGVNLIGLIKGRKTDAGTIVVSAHYDHLGIKNGEIFNGADDNASGVAALLEIANYFSKNKPQHDLVFCAFDAEELNSAGARAFIENLPFNRENLKLNFNIDMISISPKNELFIAGASHYPVLKTRLSSVVQKEQRINIRWGHDTPEPRYQDWTFASDHRVFHRVQIPFIYFGVEDHSFYHQPEDTFEHIDQDFFVDAANFVFEALLQLDNSFSKFLRPPAQR